MSEVLDAPVSSNLQPKPNVDRTFLPYLEGIRGFFGLYIGLAHAWLRASQLRPDLFAYTPFAQHFHALSHTSIALFIVISGYVLGLPVARRGQTFRGGRLEFAKRRALRLLPAYYAALLIAIPISLMVAPFYGEELSHKSFVVSTLLHFAMLHNISNPLIVTLDAPMWSIAVECDIYIVFALLLVPLARRFGFVAMVVAAFALGFAPTLVGALQHRWEGYRLSESCFWYIGLFALGYAAANLTIDRGPAAARLRQWPWSIISLVFVGLTIVSVTYAKPYETSHGTLWLADLLAGLAIAAQFTANAQARLDGRTTWFERFFLWRPLLFFGTFSYSFYLIHLPIIDLVVSRTQPGWSDPRVLEQAAAGVVIALVIAYGFYWVFERPFMTAYRRRGDEQSLRSDRSRNRAEPIAVAAPSARSRSASRLP